MKKHLYNSSLAKVGWFVKRFGFFEIFLKPLRVFFAPVIIPFLPAKRFDFQGKELSYFYHRYNMTWAAERCIEVPIGKAYLEQFGDRNVLEIGNVLSHYFPARHDILDKFEKGSGIINQDIVGFQPNKKFDLILSISTFEHIGFDDESGSDSSRKILEAIATAKSLLTEKGKLVITVPIGYNPDLNLMIRKGTLGCTQQFFFKRTHKLHWEPCSKEEALVCRYKSPFPYANAILVAEFMRRQDSSQTIELQGK